MELTKRERRYIAVLLVYAAVIGVVIGLATVPR